MCRAQWSARRVYESLAALAGGGAASSGVTSGGAASGGVPGGGAKAVGGGAAYLCEYLPVA